MSWWNSTNTDQARPLTMEMLEEAFNKLRDAPQVAHGSKEDPHILNPNTMRCMCGFERRDLRL